MFSRFINVVMYISASLLLAAENIAVPEYTAFFLYLPQLMHICLSYFHLYATMNRVPANTHIQVFGLTCFNSLRYIPRSGITWSPYNFVFNHLRKCCIVFQSRCTIFHSHQQSVRVPVSPHPQHHYLTL